MGSANQILPENVGWRIGTASLVGAVTVSLFYGISSLFVISESIRLNNVGFSLVLSITLTTVFPALLFRSLFPVLRDWINDTVLYSEGIRNRGERDRAIVLLSSITSLIGMMIYLFSPKLLGAEDSQVIYAVTNSRFSFMEKLQIVYVDLLTVCGFGLFVGFFIIAWYRVMYPRFCHNCNKARVTGEICQSCGAPVVGRPSHVQNILNFLRNDGIRQYTGLTDTDKEQTEDETSKD